MRGFGPGAEPFRGHRGSRCQIRHPSSDSLVCELAIGELSQIPLTGPAFNQVFLDGAGFQCYDWQLDAATRPDLPRLIEAPTGCGKTEGILFAWLWRRCLAGDPALAARTPRRLAIALPMRTLVEQTHNRIAGQLDRLQQSGHLSGVPPRVFRLLGGEADDDWELDPSADQILVGTVDMLLSRALNRGYGRGRSLWPIEFGLLNGDTWWVFDEVQLLDAALHTSCQLAALRRDPAFGVDGLPNHTTWMSATLDPAWFKTVDHERPGDDTIVRLSEHDINGALKARLNASKRLRLEKLDTDNESDYVNAFVKEVLTVHATRRPDGDSGKNGWLTLAVCNTVKRARTVLDTLARHSPDADLVLLHSRFRPPDRAAALARALGNRPDPDRGRIVVTTQVIEAGVDVDAAGLVTELCPWPSLVQRAGRLNRAGKRGSRDDGERSGCELVVMDHGQRGEGLAAPYEQEELDSTREVLETEVKRAGKAIPFSPAAIERMLDPDRRDHLLPRPRRGISLRRPDLLELFDTDPTLDGDDVDVGGYIRLGDDLTVLVAWRPEDDPRHPAKAPRSAPAPVRDELCPVPIADRDELAKREPWRWSYALREWEKVRGVDIRPGDVLIVSSKRGGYSPSLGWNPESDVEVPPSAMPEQNSLEPDSDEADPTQAAKGWIRLDEHTEHVVERVEAILSTLAPEDTTGLLSQLELDALRQAARFHDAGKAHETFQSRIREGEKNPPDAGVIVAKSPSGGRAARRQGQRKSVFRHEVVSVLVYQANVAASEQPARLYDLVSYLIGAHHGKLRLTPRIDHSHPTDGSEITNDRLPTCLGVKAGDSIPASDNGAKSRINLGGGVEAQPVVAADVSVFELGGRPDDGWSWSDVALRLRDELGALRLAYLEALLRSADRAASAFAAASRAGDSAVHTAGER